MGNKGNSPVLQGCRLQLLANRLVIPQAIPEQDVLFYRRRENPMSCQVCGGKAEDRYSLELLRNDGRASLCKKCFNKVVKSFNTAKNMEPYNDFVKLIKVNRGVKNG